jgi:hypothetical protein
VAQKLAAGVSALAVGHQLVDAAFRVPGKKALRVPTDRQPSSDGAPALGQRRATDALVSNGYRGRDHRNAVAIRGQPDVRRRYPLAGAADAHRDLEARRTTGQIVLLA